MTPLGRDVLPEVNCRNAMSVGSMVASRGAGAGAASSSTVRMPRSVWTLPSTGSTKGRVGGVVRSRPAPEARVMCATVSW